MWLHLGKVDLYYLVVESRRISHHLIIGAEFCRILLGENCNLLTARLAQVFVSVLIEVSNTKQNEDNKPILDQQNIMQNVEKDVQKASHEVIKKQDADYHQRKYDAKEKGRGQEYTNQNQKRKNKEKEDKVIKKENNSHFDMKI